MAFKKTAPKSVGPATKKAARQVEIELEEDDLIEEDEAEDEEEEEEVKPAKKAASKAPAKKSSKKVEEEEEEDDDDEAEGEEEEEDDGDEEEEAPATFAEALKASDIPSKFHAEIREMHAHYAAPAKKAKRAGPTMVPQSDRLPKNFADAVKMKLEMHPEFKAAFKADPDSPQWCKVAVMPANRQLGPVKLALWRAEQQAEKEAAAKKAAKKPSKK